MKNLLKFILIVFSFLISFLGNPCDARFDNNIVIDSISVPSQVIYFTDYENENAIASSNNSGYVIFSSKVDDKEQFFSSVEKTSPQAKLLQQIFSKDYNRIFACNSHEISLSLKNEICTRAP